MERNGDEVLGINTLNPLSQKNRCLLTLYIEWMRSVDKKSISTICYQ